LIPLGNNRRPRNPVIGSRQVENLLAHAVLILNVFASGKGHDVIEKALDSVWQKAFHLSIRVTLRMLNCPESQSLI
jgi:hypothetical protein